MDLDVRCEFAEINTNPKSNETAILLQQHIHTHIPFNRQTFYRANTISLTVGSKQPRHQQRSVDTQTLSATISLRQTEIMFFLRSIFSRSNE